MHVCACINGAAIINVQPTACVVFKTRNILLHFYSDKARLYKMEQRVAHRADV